MILPVRRFLACGLAASLLGLAWLYPQAAQPQKKPAPQPQESRPTFKVQSNLILVDCTVRDRKGNLIRDLRKEDFTIYEDGAPQDIVTFSLESIPTSTETAPESAPPPEPAKPGAAPATPPVPKPGIVNFSAPGAERKKEELKDRRLVVLFFDL